MRPPKFHGLRWFAALTSPLWVSVISYAIGTIILAAAVQFLGLGSYWDQIDYVAGLGPLPLLTGFGVVYACGMLAPRDKYLFSLLVGGLALFLFSAIAIAGVLAGDAEGWSLVSLGAALLGGGFASRMVLGVYGDD